MLYTTKETMERLNAVDSSLFDDARTFYDRLSRGEDRRLKVAAEAIGDEVGDILSTQVVPGITEAIKFAFETKPVLAALADEKMGKSDILEVGMILEGTKRLLNGDPRAFNFIKCFVPTDRMSDDISTMIENGLDGHTLIVAHMVLKVFDFSPKELSKMTIIEFLNTAIGRLADIPNGEIVEYFYNQLLDRVNVIWGHAADKAKFVSFANKLNDGATWASDPMKGIHEEARAEVDEILDDTLYVQKNLQLIPNMPTHDNGTADVFGWVYNLFTTIFDFVIPDDEEWVEYMKGEN